MLQSVNERGLSRHAPLKFFFYFLLHIVSIYISHLSVSSTYNILLFLHSLNLLYLMLSFRCVTFMYTMRKKGIREMRQTSSGTAILIPQEDIMFEWSVTRSALCIRIIAQHKREVMFLFKDAGYIRNVTRPLYLTRIR